MTVFISFFSDSTPKHSLKDLSKEIATELTRRLQGDPIAQDRFYQSFGLDPEKTQHHRVLRSLNLSELFPDTPVRQLKDVFETLQLYDLVELLEKTKLRALRPALPLQEIGKLTNASNRPTTFFGKTAVLIINNSTRGADDTAERIEAFLKTFDSGSQVSTITGRPSIEKIEILKRMKRNRKLMETHGNSFKLEAPSTVSKQHREMDLSGLRSSTEMTSEEKTKLEELEDEIKQLDEELRTKKENFQMDLLTTLNQWTEKEGRLELNSFLMLFSVQWLFCCIKSVFYASLVEESYSTIFYINFVISLAMFLTCYDSPPKNPLHPRCG